MEGSMDRPVNTPNLGFDYESHRPEDGLEFASTTDRTGYWFAAAVFFAFMAAGIIVYRAANSESRTASIDAPAISGATNASPITYLPPAHVHVEGIDP
jgi:hypothetical protein